MGKESKGEIIYLATKGSALVYRDGIAACDDSRWRWDSFCDVAVGPDKNLHCFLGG
jgi:hypothetical protein